MHILWDRDDSVPPALVSASRQRDHGESFIEVDPRELANLLVRAEQASIGEHATEVEVGVERLNVLEHSGDISDGFVQCRLLPAFGDLRDGVGEASYCIGWLQDGRQTLAFVVEGGGGEEA